MWYSNYKVEKLYSSQMIEIYVNCTIMSFCFKFALEAQLIRNFDISETLIKNYDTAQDDISYPILIWVKKLLLLPKMLQCDAY